jgi:hypothetical protein
MRGVLHALRKIVIRNLACACVVTATSIPSAVYASSTSSAREKVSVTLPAAPKYVHDFHLDFKNDEPWFFSTIAVDSPTLFPFDVVQTHQNPPPNDLTGSVNWLGGHPAAGSTIVLGFTIVTLSQHFTNINATWSFVNAPNQKINGADGVKIEATPVGDPMVDFRISNTGGEYLLLTNVNTQSNISALPLDTAVDSTSGFVSLWPSLLLAPGEESPHFISSPIDAGKYFYAEFTSYQSDASGDLLSEGVGIVWGRPLQGPHGPYR